MEAALDEARQGGYISIPKEDDVDVLNLASATSYQAFEAKVRILREEVFWSIRGSYLPFMQGANGGGDTRGDAGVAKHAGSDPLEYLLAKAVGRTLTRQLAPALIKPRYGNDVGMPRVVLGGVNWAETKEQMEIAKTLINELRVPVSKRWLYESAQVPPPEGEDDSVAPQSPPPGPMGGPGGMLPPADLGSPPEMGQTPGQPSSATTPTVDSGADQFSDGETDAVLAAYAAGHQGLQLKTITDSLGRKSRWWVRPEGEQSLVRADKEQPASPPPPAPTPTTEPAKGIVGRTKEQIAQRLDQAVSRLEQQGTAGKITGTGLRRLAKGVKAAEHALLFAMHKSQGIAVEAGKARGLTESQTKGLATALAIGDFVGGYATGYLGLTLGGAIGAKVGSVLPSASLGYIAYSAARDPIATYAAARKVIASTFRGQSAHAGYDPTDVDTLADLFEGLNDRQAEWATALVTAALADGDDIRSAAARAAEAMAKHPIPLATHDFDPQEVLGFDPEASEGQPAPAQMSEEVPAPDSPIYRLSPNEIHTDPARFQWKPDADPTDGTVVEWEGKYDPETSAPISVWEDPADRRRYVVDGHHRLAKAKQSGAAWVPVQFVDAGDAGEARDIGKTIDDVQEFADRSHLVKKTITNKLGRKQTVWVDPNKDQKASERKARGEEFRRQNQGMNPKEALQKKKADAEPLREQARQAFVKAQEDPSKLTPEDLKALSEHLGTLTRDELRQHARALEQKVGGRKAELADRLVQAVQSQGVNRGGDNAGRGDAGGSPASPPDAGGSVAGETERPRDESLDRDGSSQDQPSRGRSAERIPAEASRVNAKLDRFAKVFRDRGQHEVAGWMDKLREHINNVGVAAALDSVRASGSEGKGEKGQYEGAWKIDRVSDFVQPYLERHGITLVGTFSLDDYDRSKPLVSSLSPTQDRSEDTGSKKDYLPEDPTLEDKLQEAKNLPGLEKSEDINNLMGKQVTHLTPDVLAKLDETYGPGQWIVKAYGEDAAAGYGIFFPQRAIQIAQNARDTIWAAGENLAKYGFSLRRDKEGKVIGLQHTTGDTYDFGKRKYDKTIDGEVRYWADKAAEAADSEHAAMLPGGGKQFMAQPAFPVVGISDADRAAGVTIKQGVEGRVHVITRNGKAEIVPYSSWMKQDHFPVVFETEDTRAMAKAAQDAINALPESERNGQIYAPDIVKTKDGWRVVEANPANHTGSSGYLGDSPFIIDSYVSHLTGRTPAHVQFIRNLLTQRKGSQ
jgi:hypothetical protein